MDVKISTENRKSREPEVYMVVLDGIKSVQEHKPIYVVAKEVRLEDIIAKEESNAD